MRLGRRLGWTPQQTLESSWWELTEALWDEISAASPPEQPLDSGEVKAFFRGVIARQQEGTDA